MLCAISGEAPQVPVVSRKSGNVYEKRLIEAYISENGTEPTTGEAFTTADLIDLKTSRTVRPRPATLTSIPSLLGVFQEEWDALALETYTLKQNLAQTRQELSTALYQHDAAVRVIARLTRERDEARGALSKVNIGARAPPSNGDAMQVDNTESLATIAARVESTQESLSKTRRKRQMPEDWATADQISSFTPTRDSEPLYSRAKVFSIDNSGDRAIVGGTDGIAGVFSLSQQKILQELKAGGGTITDAVWAGQRAITSTTTGHVKVFEGQEELVSFDAHAGEISGIALHASGSILASVGVDKSFVIYDLANLNVVTQVYTNSVLTCTKFHPDGHILAAGDTDGRINIFSVTSGTLAATFECGGPIKCLFFSENGTWLAVVTENSSGVSIWDLRKSAEIKTLETGSLVSSISWDYTGQYLLTGGPGGVTVEQYSKASKEWSEILKSAVPATSVAWGARAQSIVTTNRHGILTELGVSS